MRTRTLLSIGIFLVLAPACGGSTAQLEQARAASYDGEREVILRETAEAVRALYDKGLEIDTEAGTIKTAWHGFRVRDASTTRDENAAASSEMPSGVSQGGSSGGMASASPRDPRSPDSAPMKMSFVRFDVTLVGGPPWRVEVVGYASEYDHTTGKPMPLHGADRPYWLDGRQKKLEVAIYERLRKYERKTP